MTNRCVLQTLAALALAGLAACAGQPASYDEAALYGSYGYCGGYFCPSYDPFWGYYDPFWGPYYGAYSGYPYGGYFYGGYPYGYGGPGPIRPGPWPQPNPPPLRAGWPAPRPPFNPPPGHGPVFHAFGPPRPALGGAPLHAPAPVHRAAPFSRSRGH